MKRILTVDVGNTAVTWGIFLKKSSRSVPHPTRVWKTPTTRFSNLGFLKNKLTPSTVAGVIVSSVVPHLDSSLKKSLKRLFSCPITFITPKTKMQIKNRYGKPSEVGADRIVNARAAVALYRGASIVIDFGTATTFDVVSRKAEYRGGIIAPGPKMASRALYEETAKLPLAELTHPAAILGRNTQDSIRSGLYHGYRGLVLEIIRQLKKHEQGPVRIFTTGGQAKWILKGLHLRDHYVPDLTLIGLYFAWQDIYT